MKLMFVSCAALGALAAGSGAEAQVTQSYSYDGNGRLIGVTTSGSGGTNTAAYAYDAAHNRTSRVRSGTTTYAALDSLPDGGLLSLDEALVSPDGRFTFAMRSTGRLELWKEDDPLWRLEDLVGGPEVDEDETGVRLAVRREQSPEAWVWSVSNDGALIARAGQRTESWSTNDITSAVSTGGNR
jgi:YD repeat-containing protein